MVSDDEDEKGKEEADTGKEEADTGKEEEPMGGEMRARQDPGIWDLVQALKARGVRNDLCGCF